VRWFKHYSDARMSPQLRRIEKKLGEGGYARAYKLMELVAQLGGLSSQFSPQLDLNDASTDIDFIAEEWRVRASEARKTLNVFAELGFIDREKWKGQIIFIPAMLEALDEWTRKQRSGSGASLSNSGASRTESESEPESE
jgi:hypothetical protein